MKPFTIKILSSLITLFADGVISLDELWGIIDSRMDNKDIRSSHAQESDERNAASV